MSRGGDVTGWIMSLREGDREAAGRLWEVYSRRLMGLLDRKLPAHMRRDEDEEDAALSAFRSFLSGIDGGRFPDLADRDGLWAVLSLIAVRKARSALRRKHAAKRGGGAVAGESGIGPGIGQVIDPADGPESAALFAEECEALLDRLPDDQHRQIAVLRLHGHTVEEVAARVGVTSRTAKRRLEIIRRLWKEGGDADG